MTRKTTLEPQLKHVHAQCPPAVQDMGIRRRAFAQKQLSIRVALEIGDGIARRERRHLLVEAMAGWRRRARLGLAVSARCRLALASCQHRCWASWKSLHHHQAGTSPMLMPPVLPPKLHMPQLMLYFLNILECVAVFSYGYEWKAHFQPGACAASFLIHVSTIRFALRLHALQE